MTLFLKLRKWSSTCFQTEKSLVLCKPLVKLDCAHMAVSLNAGVLTLQEYIFFCALGVHFKNLVYFPHLSNKCQFRLTSDDYNNNMILEGNN